MDQETNITFLETRDFRDFLVAHALLEFQQNALALVVGKPLENAHDFGELVVLIGLFVRGGSVADDFLELDVVHRLHPLFFSEDVEDPISTHREEPRFEVVADFLGLLLTESEESVLYDVAGAIDAMEDGRGISDERGFVLRHRPSDELLARLGHVG